MSERNDRVGIIHATPAAMEPVRAAFAEHLPAVVALNFLDEGLLDGLNRSGRITPELTRRLAAVIAQADSAGVSLILTTCSAYSPIMDQMRPLAKAPIITIDGLLFEEAARAADHLGIIGTSTRALETTTVPSLTDEAARQGRQQRYSIAAEPEAFNAILNGDVAAAGQRLAATARRLVGEGVGAIMIAQASLSRALPYIGDVGVPILTSPTLAVSRVAATLGSPATS